MRLDRIRYHFRIGRCSGFKWCCILFYTFPWQLCFREDEVHGGTTTDERWSWLVSLYHEWNGEDVWYIRCPRCIVRGDKVKVRKCTRDCGCHEEFEKVFG